MPLPERAEVTAVVYDAEHRRLRERWRRVVEAGDASCARCGRPISPDALFDLGHDDVLRDGSVWGVEHRRCNRGAPSRRRARVRRARYWSREW